MTPTEGQTTTPSGADVDERMAVMIEHGMSGVDFSVKPVAEFDVLAVMDDVADRLDKLVKDVLYRPSVAAPELRKARTSVAALIARNAELEAQTPSALREKLRSCEEALQAVEADRDALAGERDALREVTDEMVERAARARCVFFGWEPGGHVTYAGTKKVCKKPDGSPLLQWEFCKEETRAALTAALARS